jgi:hypothetical protein
VSLRQIDKFVRWNNQAKQYLPIMWRREVLPSWLTFSQQTLLPISVAATGSPIQTLTIAQPYASVEGNDQNLGTPFEVRSLVMQDSTVGTLNANFLVKLKEVGEARDFMNNPVHVRTIFGTGQQPALLREPYMFLSQHNISVQVTNLGIATTMRLYLCGAQYFPWSPELLRYKLAKADMTSLLQKWLNRRQYVTPYWQTTDTSVALTQAQAAAATPVDFSAKISDDGHFEAFGHAAVSTGPFLMTISEVKTKQTLVNGSMSQVNGVGDARFPTIYPTPYLIPAGYRMKITITNLDTTDAVNNIYLTFFGRKIYAPFTQVDEKTSKLSVPTPGDAPTLMVPRPIAARTK